MYLRTVKAKGAEGVEFEYIRLVEAHWENGRSKQRVIANLVTQGPPCAASRESH